MPPIRARQGLQNIQTRTNFPRHCLSVGAEGEEGVESDAQNSRIAVQRNEGAIEEHLRMIVELVRVCREESHR